MKFINLSVDPCWKIKTTQLFYQSFNFGLEKFHFCIFFQTKYNKNLYLVNYYFSY